MLDNQALDLQLFLDELHSIETRVAELIGKSSLNEQEKQYILDHILIVPGKGAIKGGER